MTDNSDKKFVTISQIAKTLGVSKGTIRNWEKAGKLSSTVDENGTHLYDLVQVRDLGKDTGTLLEAKPSLEDRLLSIDDAAQALGVDRSTILRWENVGLLQSTRTLGGMRRYAGGDVSRVLHNRTPHDPLPEKPRQLSKAALESYIPQPLKYKTISYSNHPTAQTLGAPQVAPELVDEIIHTETSSTIDIKDVAQPTVDAPVQSQVSEVIQKRLDDHPPVSPSFIGQITKARQDKVPIDKPASSSMTYVSNSTKFLSVIVPTAIFLFIVGLVGVAYQLYHARFQPLTQAVEPTEGEKSLALTIAASDNKQDEGQAGKVLGASSDLIVPSGGTGAIGSTGPTGLIGDAGATGPSGVKGFVGINGATGPSGGTGANGPTGSVGVSGPTGGAGGQGSSGPTGAVGEQGANGQNLLNQVDNLIFPYPVVDMSFALGSSLGSGQSTTSSSSALILLDGMNGAIRAQSYAVGGSAGLNISCGAGESLNNFTATGGIVTGGTCSPNAADLAESYFSKERLDKGDLVEIDPDHAGHVRKSQKPYSASSVGIITTNPWKVLGSGELWEVVYPVALVGRVPVKVTSLTGLISPGDSIASSQVAGFGMKAIRSGTSVGKALAGTQSWNEVRCPIVSSLDSIVWPEDDGTNLEGPCFRIPSSSLSDPQGASQYMYVGKIMAFVSNSWQLADSQGLEISGLNISLDNLIDQIKSALGFTQGAFVSPLARIDQIQTNVLSPLGQESSGIAVNLGENQTFGIHDDTGEEVLGVDSQGNARLQGDLSARQATFAGDATISGTLYADHIVSKDQIDSSPSSSIVQHITNLTTITYATPTSEQLILPNDSADLDLASPIMDATSSSLLALFRVDEASVASSDGTLIQLPQKQINLDGSLVVLGQTHLGQTSIAGTLLASRIDIGGEGIATVGDTLYLQRNKLAAVDLLAGTLIVTPLGNVIINGDVAIGGNLAVGGVLGVQSVSSMGHDLTISLAGQPSFEATESAIPVGSLMVKGASESAIATINASGSAQFSGNITASGSASFAGISVGSSSTGINVPIQARQTSIIVTGINQATTSFGVYVVPSWNTTSWISRKATNGFVINFGTPAPTNGGFIDWFIVNQTGH